MDQPAGELLRRGVFYRGIKLGVVVDALLDEGLHRLLGLEIVCRDGVSRFLPFPACDVVDGRLTTGSALVLLERELEFYRRRGRALASVRGLPVRRDGADVGVLEDVVVGPDGGVRALLVATADGLETVEPRPGIALGPDALRPAV